MEYDEQSFYLSLPMNVLTFTTPLLHLGAGFIFNTISHLEIYVLHKSKVVAKLSNRVKFMSYINWKFREEVHENGVTGNWRGSLIQKEG